MLSGLVTHAMALSLHATVSQATVDAVQVIGAPDTQPVLGEGDDASQTSVPLQYKPSAHAALFGAC